MKKILFILVVFSLFTTANTYAVIWRVNNGTGISANFTDVPPAIAAANAGDTILIEPGSYSSFTVTKRLVILGNGYFSDAAVNSYIHTLNPNLQARMVSSQVGNVTFDIGGEHSVMMGLYTSNVYTYCSDILIKRCYIYQLYLSNYNFATATYGNRDSIDVRQCILTLGITTYYFSNTGSVGITDVNFQNNVIGNYVYSAVSLPLGISGYFQNNIFDSQGGGNMSMFNFQISNNIIIAGAFTPNNSVYFNNISTNGAFGTANNNLMNVSTASLFTNFGTTPVTETRYTLSPAGPGIGAGFNGVNVGIFGGPDPYKLSGVPPIPAIYQLSAPATTTSSTLPVTISTRSNN